MSGLGHHNNLRFHRPGSSGSRPSFFR
jgi:hypothetical protein